MHDDPPFEHDALFKNVFEQPSNARALLRMVLPAKFVLRARWQTLRVESGELRPALERKLQTDLLFSVRVDARKVYVYLLVEHQSSVDRRMVMRMLGYMNAIWDRLERQAPSEPVPPILPILVCHDRRGWRAPVQLQEIFGLDLSLRETLSPHLPDYRLILLDLTAMDEQELRRGALTDVARLALWLLKTARDNPDLAAGLERWLDVFRQVALAPNGVAAAVALLNYATRVGDIDPDRVARITAELGPAVQEAYMTGAERLIQRGREEGRQRQADLVIRLLERRFGALPSHLQARVATATFDELGVFTERLIAAKSIEEIL